MEFNADRSLIWARAVCVLLLAYCMQAAVLFLARYVIYYTNFHFPLCLASFTFILASIMSLVAMILCQSTDDVWLLHGRWLWLQLGFAGACMGAATVSDYASLLHLPLSSVLCLKVSLGWCMHGPKPCCWRVQTVLLPGLMNQNFTAVKLPRGCTAVQCAELQPWHGHTSCASCTHTALPPITW